MKTPNKNNLIIKYINYGIASRIGNTIYLHKKLKKYPKLNKELILHEKSHTNGYCIKDIMADFNCPHLKKIKKQYYKFIIKNPSSLIQFIPIWKYENKMVIDLSLLVMYFIFIIALTLMYLSW